MLILKSYIDGIQRYADFNGRTGRLDFFSFLVCNFAFSMACIRLDSILDLQFSNLGYGWIYLIYSLFAFLPALAITVRRLHDIGKSGSRIFVSLIPIAGPILLIIDYFKIGYESANIYGEVAHKNEDAASAAHNWVQNVQMLLIITVGYYSFNRVFHFLFREVFYFHFTRLFTPVISTLLSPLNLILPMYGAILLANTKYRKFAFWAFAIMIGVIYFDWIRDLFDQQGDLFIF